MTHATAPSHSEQTASRPRSIADQVTPEIREVAKSMSAYWSIDESIVIARRRANDTGDIRYEIVVLALEEMRPLALIDPFTADEGEG